MDIMVLTVRLALITRGLRDHQGPAHMVLFLLVALACITGHLDTLPGQTVLKFSLQ